MAQATSKLTRTAWWSRPPHQISTDAPGTVISTDPAGNALVKKGDTVTLNVASAAGQKVAVPEGLVEHHAGQRQCHPAERPG